jgi:hypothetical protein
MKNFQKKWDFLYIFFLTIFAVLGLEAPFFGYDEPSGWQKIVRKRIFEISIFSTLRPFFWGKSIFSCFALK